MAENPYVENGRLYAVDGSLICIVATRADPSPAWVKWLKDPKNRAFTFTGESGGFIAGKERQRHRTGNVGFYWYGHIRINDQLHHRSLGSIQTNPKTGRDYTENITLEKMERVAADLARLRLKDAAPTREEREAWQEAETGRRRRGYEPAGRLRLPVEAVDLDRVEQLNLFGEPGEQDRRGDSYYANG